MDRKLYYYMTKVCKRKHLSYSSMRPFFYFRPWLAALKVDWAGAFLDALADGRVYRPAEELSSSSVSP